MAEGTQGPGPEGGPPAQPAPAGEVFTNAALPDAERLQKAQELLKAPITPKQEEAVLKAHQEAAGEPGKDKNEAGVYNYTQGQLLRKARILKEAEFSKEQRRTLMESGIVGAALRRYEFEAFNLAIYAGDVTLHRIATEFVDIANAGLADEDFFKRTLNRLAGLVDGDRVTDKVLERQLRLDFERWRISVETRRPDSRPERRGGSVSQFEQTINNINVFEQLIPTLAVGTPDRVTAEANLQNLKTDRDVMLVEVRNLGLLNPLKASLFKTFHDSRVEVTYRDKVSDHRSDGRPGVIYTLEGLQNIADTGSWEANVNFWADPARVALEQRLGGTLDYFEMESLKLIREVVVDRKKYNDPYNPESYPDRGIVDLWDYEYTLRSGENYAAEDFSGVRDIVEDQRKRKPKVPNRGDYESWFALVADNPEEAEEMIPIIVGSVRSKLVGPPQSQSSNLQQEQEKWGKAIDYLRNELGYKDGDPKFIKLATIVRQELNLLGIEVFSNLVKETWEPYLTYATDIARGFKDTEFQDHTIDVLLLDREGIKLAALELLALNNWEYYRFGRNTRNTNETLAYGDALQIQQERRDWIENWLVNHELRPMNDLLNAEVINNQVVINGDPNHPAFQRMKDELDALDAQDPQRNAQGFITRWHEYIRKAIHWQRTGESSDPRNKRQRVIFQHPLARAFRPAGFKDNQGNVTGVSEFWEMFREVQIQDPKAIERLTRGKRERVSRSLKSAERMVEFSMSNAVAGGPRHFFDVYEDNRVLSSPHGEIITNTAGEKFLRLATGAQLRIERDSNGKAVVNDIEPHMKMVHDLMQRIVEQDKKKPVKRQLIKFYNILRNKLGIDLALPFFSAWYLGAHDSNRPHLLKFLRQVPEWDQQLNERAKLREFDITEGNDGYGYGADPKTATARMPEDERRLRILAEVYLKSKFKHFNYPGQDDPEGGIKEFRNLLFQVYGISLGTVEVNALIGKAWLGEVDFLGAFGCETWAQFVGLEKGPNEIVYAKTRGFFANPRDAENYEKRLAAIVEQAKLWTSGKEDAGGMLDTSPISGAFNARAINKDPSNYLAENSTYRDASISDPEKGFDEYLSESAYRAYVETSARIAGPLATIMQSRSKLENVYGRNPQSAMFLNTLLWYDVIKWMDENPEEFRAKFGFAYDVNLPMARIFIHTFLYESRLIYSDAQWDRIMLGYTIPKDQWDAIKDWSGNPDTKPQINSVVRANTGINRVDKLTRYSADTNGDTLGYSRRTTQIDKNTQKQEWVYSGTGTNVNAGEVVEGLLDALPNNIRDEALSNRWIPVGINSYHPETLNSLRQWLPNDGTRNKQMYQDILKVFQQDIDHAGDLNYRPKIAKKRVPIKRA